MPLSETIVSMMPEGASRIIATSLEDIVPTVDIDPKSAARIRRRVEAVVRDVVLDAARTYVSATGDYWPISSRYAYSVAVRTNSSETGDRWALTHHAISDGLRDFAAGETDQDITQILNGMAESIACITSTD